MQRVAEEEEQSFQPELGKTTRLLTQTKREAESTEEKVLPNRPSYLSTEDHGGTQKTGLTGGGPFALDSALCWRIGLRVPSANPKLPPPPPRM